MNPEVGEMLDRIRQIEAEMEQELQRRRAELRADFEHRRIGFEREVLEQQRRFTMGLLTYLRKVELRNVVTAPIVYPVILPLLLLDLAVTAYQSLCFPLYGIAPVRRRDYLVFDRSHLAYRKLIEKIYCAYYSYANGLIAQARETVGRTEQYWCPIKHAQRILHAHPYTSGFVDFADTEAYRGELQTLRANLALIDGAAPTGVAPR